ncbi:MAG: hypothetical protein JM58_06035 [Peptococcaceae bacterium BICA1-8]|nr:MAG: hypothetical protein JM58_06035 [Peptococcaceae bacterium BICA1-8]
MIFILIKQRNIIFTGLIFLILTMSLGFGTYYLTNHKKQINTSKNKFDYIILGYNDLGMHCIQPDYSKFLILPPGNNFQVQIFKRGKEPEILMKGIKVKYKINTQDEPSKYTNFWEYSENYGFDIPKGVGLTGNTLEGYMEPEPNGKYWIITGVPVIGGPGGETGGPTTPYHTATITVIESSTDKVLAQFDDLVVPVSSEMQCANCHGPEDTWTNILREHDEEEKTSLFAQSQQGILHSCSECHPDPILNKVGKENVPYLSLAIHGFHADKMTGKLEPVCYNCHPGEQTKCNRGVMKANGKSCTDCHGDMSNVAKTIKDGREPWLDEPNCQMCHEEKYSTNENTLYRNSYLLNGPAKSMNNKILCASCHNSPHAEWPSILEIDNILPQTYQGDNGPIGECTTCHIDNRGKIHR